MKTVDCGDADAAEDGGEDESVQLPAPTVYLDSGASPTHLPEDYF